MLPSVCLLPGCAGLSEGSVHSWFLSKYNPQHFVHVSECDSLATELKHQLLTVCLLDIISKSFIFNLSDFIYFVFILYGLKSLFSFSFHTKVFFKF